MASLKLVSALEPEGIYALLTKPTVDSPGLWLRLIVYGRTTWGLSYVDTLCEGLPGLESAWKPGLLEPNDDVDDVVLCRLKDPQELRLEKRVSLSALHTLYMFSSSSIQNGL